MDLFFLQARNKMALFLRLTVLQKCPGGTIKFSPFKSGRDWYRKNQSRLTFTFVYALVHFYHRSHKGLLPHHKEGYLGSPVLCGSLHFLWIYHE